MDNTAQSLESYVIPDDASLTRKQFLFVVATRILDDLHIDHDDLEPDPDCDPDYDDQGNLKPGVDD